MLQKESTGRLTVEAWEVRVARQVVRSYRTDQEELEAELFKRLLELKSRHRSRARNWKSFLAKSLYNSANNFVRHQRLLLKVTVAAQLEEAEREEPSLHRPLAAPQEQIDLRVDLVRLWGEMTPALRTLWLLLVYEGGNVTAVAKRLGRARKTVDYWISKLRRFLRSRGI